MTQTDSTRETLIDLLSAALRSFTHNRRVIERYVFGRDHVHGPAQRKGIEDGQRLLEAIPSSAEARIYWQDFRARNSDSEVATLLRALRSSWP